eukprot:932152-Rhodomonas_salina.1
MLQLNIKWVPKSSSSKCISVLNLVDLAGSERYSLGINPTKEERLRSEESIAINQGLTFLATVVDQLVKKARTKDTKIAINFRDHNLTKLLASSLKGDGALCLILCAPNVVSERDENVRTIRFGLTCLTIPVQAKKNVEAESTQVQELIHTQSRQKEDLDHDTALHVEEEAQRISTKAGEMIEQPKNQEEVEQQEQDLASVRLHRVEQNLNLTEGNRNLVTLRFELEQGRKDLEAISQNADNVLLMAAQKRLEDREQEILRLESYAGQLQDLVHDLSARRDDYEQLRTALEAARQGSKDRAQSDQRQIVSELELQLERKQHEINELTLSVENVFSSKQELESNVSSFLQLLERRSTADAKVAAAQELAASLAERIRMAQLCVEVDGAANENQDVEELRAIVQGLNAELEDTQRQVNSTQKLIQDLSRQVDGYLSMMPSTEREIVRRYVHDFRQQAPTLHKLKEEESLLNDELSKSEKSRTVEAPSVSAKATSQNVVTGTVTREPDDRDQELDVGFDLRSDLARL